MEEKSGDEEEERNWLKKEKRRRSGPVLRGSEVRGQVQFTDCM